MDGTIEKKARAMGQDDGYILTEIWKPRPAWQELPPAERERFCRDMIGL